MFEAAGVIRAGSGEERLELGREVGRVERLRDEPGRPVERLGARCGGSSVYFRDPDGSLLELISYTR